MKSLWADTVKMPSFQQLEGDRTADVLIIGGGIAGILCARMLTEAGADCVIAEAERICSGISANTTAKITSQHGLIYHKLIRRFGAEKARLYFEANEKALAEYRKLCSAADCGFETKDSYVYSRNHPEKLLRELEALKQIGVPAEYVRELPLPFSTAGAVKFKDQAQFHPLRFLSAMAPGLRIYENTPVRRLENLTAGNRMKNQATGNRINNSATGNGLTPASPAAPSGGVTAVTDHGRITASKIIVATHFPFIDRRGSYFLKMYQHRSYSIALEKGPDVKGMYVDEADKGMSFRNYDDLLLIGGGDHRTGKKGGGWQELVRFAEKNYPDHKIKYRWAAQDCMTLDEAPYIGHYSQNTPSLYVATGFNKWGMTSAMTAALLLRDLILEKENPYAELFSPSRSILRPQLAVNAFEATVNLLTPTTKRCSHLGCALKWNPQEHSWDCPCHGSRFTEEGHVIDSPAARDIRFKSKRNS